MNLTFNIITVVLINILVIIIYKFLETFWSYKLYKPYKWEDALKNKLISSKLKIAERKYYDKIRFYSMWFQIQRLIKDKIEGDFVELGVHKGETAKLIYEMNTNIDSTVCMLNHYWLRYE